MNGALPNRFRIIQCGHPDYPHIEVDFSELAVGAPNTKVGQGANKWNGGFRGRPELIDALLPEIQTRHSMRTPVEIRQMRAQLRSFWRFLDQWETQTNTNITLLEDIGDVHGAAWIRQEKPPRRSTVQCAVRLLNDARDRAELSPIFWEALPREVPDPAGTPDPAHIKLLYHELKRLAFAILRRWAEADRLAVSGKSLIGIKRRGCKASPVTLEDAHATYREIIKLSGHPVPGAKEIGDYMGLRFLKEVPKGWPLLSTLQAGLYPSREDIQVFFHLFLIQTGWNPSTALEIDISDDRWSTDHSSGPTLKVVQAVKNRSHDTQFCLSLSKPTTSPYRIITTLLQRTAPLRNTISATRCPTPHIASRSPWLYASLSGTSKYICPLGNNFSAGLKGQRFLEWVASRHNANVVRPTAEGNSPPFDASVHPKDLIPTDLTATDVRDAYIGQIYLRSGYNWLLAMFAAGHKSIRSLRAYLNKRSYRMAGEGHIRTFQAHLWSEIENHQLVDPAILHALCRQGEISPEQRDRWLRSKDRTYVGMGCRDFSHPPPDISPEHRKGEGCRIQRCTLCRLGILFSDSMPFLARRLEELIWFRERLPIPTWVQSSFPDEFDSLELSLQNFSTEEVGKQRAHWRAEILTGKHIPLSFEGSYGSCESI